VDSASRYDGNLRSLDWFLFSFIAFSLLLIPDYCITEHICSNLLPNTLSIIALKAPLSTSWVWLSMAIIDTLGIHSGYHLPFLHSPQFHDYHHLKFNECFGWLGLLDSFHNTSTKFLESIYSKRHRTLITFTQAGVLYPERTVMKKD
jgi:methylsterol monooxygenase